MCKLLSLLLPPYIFVYLSSRSPSHTHLEGGVCKVTDGLICVVHGHGDTTTLLEVKHLGALWLATLRCEHKLHLKQ